jgi:hypothetical protein
MDSITPSKYLIYKIIDVILLFEEMRATVSARKKIQ